MVFSGKTTRVSKDALQSVPVLSHGSLQKSVRCLEGVTPLRRSYVLASSGRRINLLCAPSHELGDARFLAGHAATTLGHDEPPPLSIAQRWIGEPQRRRCRPAT